MAFCDWRCKRRWLMVVVGLGALGCSSSIGFYAQAARGGLAVQLKAKPIDKLLKRSDLSEALRQKLEVVLQVREFAQAELGLEVGSSYRQYADLERDFVVWNVVAAPPLGVAPVRWCYPVAGCVSYRGYFRSEGSQRFAKKLARRGYDVSIGGVSAYSTLGWLSDPVLNTFVDQPEADLAGTLFHELAHATFYAPGDTAFSESLATAIEAYSVERWLTQNGRTELLEAYTARQRVDRNFQQQLFDLRGRLETLYQSDAPDEQKLRLKKDLFLTFAEKVVARPEESLADDERLRWKGWVRWVERGLNNADLAAVGAYWVWVPALNQQLATLGWEGFVSWVHELLELPSAERERRLEAVSRQGEVDASDGAKTQYESAEGPPIVRERE